MDVHFVIKELNVDLVVGVWILLPIIGALVSYIIVSAYFIHQLTKGFYKREFTFGFPFGIVIKGDLNEDSALNHLNNKIKGRDSCIKSG